MKPGVYSLEIYRGDSAKWLFRLWDDESKTVPTDLTGSTPKAEIRDRSGGMKIAELLCETSSNEITVTLDPMVSRELPLKRGFWDLELVYEDNRVVTVVAGSVIVIPDITNSDRPAAVPA